MSDDISGYEDIIGDNSGYEDILSAPAKEHPENILQRAAKALSATASTGMQRAGNSPLGFSVNTKFPFIPTMPTDNPALDAGLAEANMPITKGNPYGQGAISLAGNILGSAMLGGGAAMRGAKGALESEANPFSKAAKLDVIKQMRQKSGEFHEGVTGKFYEGMKKLGGTVNLRKNIDEINHTAAFQPELQELIDASPQLQNLVNHPELADAMPLEESQALINEVGQMLPRLTKTTRSVKPGEVPAFEFHNNLKRTQEAHVSGMKDLRQNYGPDIEDSVFMKSITSKKNAPERAIKTKFGGAEGQEAADKIFGKDLTKKANNVRRADEFSKTVKTGIKLGSGAKFLKMIGF